MNQKMQNQEKTNAIECFENVIDDNGIQKIEITFHPEYVKAVVEQNEIGIKNLKETLCNVESKNLPNGLVELKWHFKKAVKVEKVQKFILNGICYYAQNDWQVWINGAVYDQNNKNIENAVIESVSQEEVVIVESGKKITLKLDI
jgi:hypothetical protein